MPFEIGSETLESLVSIAEEAFRHVPEVAFFVKDVDGRFITGNPVFLSLCGVTSLSQLEGCNDLDFFSADSARLYMDDDRRVLSSGQLLKNQVEPRPHGVNENDLVLTTKIPLKDSQGRVVGLLGIVRNLSESANRSDTLKAFTPALELLEQSQKGTVDISKLAAKQGMSLSKFEREFKNIFHLTPMAYCQQMRLKKARGELLTSDKSISEISLQYGFYDQSHFTKSFTKLFGISPQKWRRSSSVLRRKI